MAPCNLFCAGTEGARSGPQAPSLRVWSSSPAPSPHSHQDWTPVPATTLVRGHKDALSSKISSFVKCRLDHLDLRNWTFSGAALLRRGSDRSLTASPPPLPTPARTLRLVGCLEKWFSPLQQGNFIPSDVTKFQKSSLWSISYIRSHMVPNILREMSRVGPCR